MTARADLKHGRQTNCVVKSENAPRDDGIVMRALCDACCLACLLRRSAGELEGMSLDEIVGLMRTTEDGLDVVPLSYEVRIYSALLVYNLVLELSLPGDIRMVVDVEIQGKALRRIGSRQVIYASGFMLRSLSRPFGVTAAWARHAAYGRFSAQGRLPGTMSVSGGCRTVSWRFFRRRRNAQNASRQGLISAGGMRAGAN